jgi:hypothetical protein
MPNVQDQPPLTGSAAPMPVSTTKSPFTFVIEAQVGGRLHPLVLPRS